MAKAERFTAFAAAVALACVFSLAAVGACADDRRSTPFPSVGDTPPRPEKPAMTTDEISKLKKDLTTVHDRQAPKGKTDQSAAPKKH